VDQTLFYLRRSMVVILLKDERIMMAAWRPGSGMEGGDPGPVEAWGGWTECRSIIPEQ
jgi:hypothetical protein